MFWPCSRLCGRKSSTTIQFFYESWNQRNHTLNALIHTWVEKNVKEKFNGQDKSFCSYSGNLAVELVHHYFYSSTSYTSSSSSRSLFSALQVNKTWLKLLSVRFCITNFFCSNDFPIWKNYIYFLLICLHYYEMFSSNLTSRMYVDFPRLFFTLVCKKNGSAFSPPYFVSSELDKFCSHLMHYFLFEFWYSRNSSAPIQWKSAFECYFQLASHSAGFLPLP